MAQAISFLSTACGFHAMRALESEARRYHQILTGAPSPLDVPLGTLLYGSQKKGIIGLQDVWIQEGKHNDNPLGLIILILATVTQIYRYPIMHPEMTLDLQKAKEVFDIAATAINQMVADRIRRKAATTKSAIP